MHMWCVSGIRVFGASSFIHKCRVEDRLRLGIGDLRLSPALDLTLHRLKVPFNAIDSHSNNTAKHGLKPRTRARKESNPHSEIRRCMDTNGMKVHGKQLPASLHDGCGYGRAPSVAPATVSSNGAMLPDESSPVTENGPSVVRLG